MTAIKIDGTAIARNIRERLGAQIKKRQESNPRYKPSLKIIQGEQQQQQQRQHGQLCRDRS
jgi:5,10-methylene-tetrahydrofolate dehydrogenase/methenyl tetrahydrofolate cyclohydrolase